MSFLHGIELAKTAQDDVALTNLLISRMPTVELSERQYVVSDTKVEPLEVVLHCTCGGSRFAISLENTLFHALLPPELASFDMENLPPSLWQTVSEMAFSQLQGPISDFLGAGVSLALDTENTVSDGVAFAFSSALESQRQLVLHLDPDIAATMKQALANKPVALEVSLASVAPVQLFGVLGSQFLTHDVLRDLVSGAAILLPQGTDPEKVDLFAGPRFYPFGFAQINSNIIKIINLRTRKTMTNDEMEDEDAPIFEDSDEFTRLEDAEVRLDFVVATHRMSVSELQEIGEGSSIVLNQPVTTEVDIYATGKHIGKGDLIEVDGRFGVRIRKIAGT